MRLVLCQPEIALNVGAAIRSAACFGCGVDIVEPCGFPLGDKGLARAAMDYGRMSPPKRHADWSRFVAQKGEGRLILLTTQGDASVWKVDWRPTDYVVVGNESAGAPEAVHAAAAIRVRIPMSRNARSLNMATAAAIALAAARRDVEDDDAD